MSQRRKMLCGPKMHQRKVGNDSPLAEHRCHRDCGLTIELSGAQAGNGEWHFIPHASVPTRC
jgi:hypothetical protein